MRAVLNGELCKNEQITYDFLRQKIQERIDLKDQTQDGYMTAQTQDPYSNIMTDNETNFQTI
jgi:hypothetical protein